MRRYRFVDSRRAEGFPVAPACRAAGVSPSAYYDWAARRRRGPARRGHDEGELLAEVRQLHRESGGTYGSPRVTAALRRAGWRVNHKRVERLMRTEGIVGVPRRKRVRTTLPGAQLTPAPDLVGRDFAPGQPGRRLACDISYLPTGQGWLYLAAVLDLGSRKVVGYALADHLRTELVTAALDVAIAECGGPQAMDRVIFHADRGCQFTSAQLAAYCARLGLRRSLGRTGICWDNAPVESFFGILKRELIHRQTFATRGQARRAVFAWVHGWYNRRRLHSTLNYLTPDEWEDRYRLPLAA